MGGRKSGAKSLSIPEKAEAIALWRAGALKPAIDGVYALEDADAAFDRFAARGKRGRVLLKL